MNEDQAVDVIDLLRRWWDNWHPPAETRALWASALADLPFELVVAEVNRLGALSTDAWPPRPGAVRAVVAAAAGLLPDGPEQAWPAVWAASRLMSRNGQLMTPAQPSWTNPIVTEMYADRRVWHQLCYAEHEPSARAAFTSQYRVLADGSRREVLSDNLGDAIGVRRSLELN